MHLQWIEAGAMGTNAIVGGAVPFAAGFAWADRHADTDNVSVTYFGDGAVNIGSVLETFNLAAAWKLPICFFIENNQYAVSTTVQEATGDPRLSARGLGFGIPSWQVDGMDTVAVYLAMQQAVEHMRNGGGPTIVEAQTYRFFHQNGPFPGSAFGYRSKDEEKGWRDRDPIAQVELHLVRRGLYTTDELKDIRTSIRDTLGRGRSHPGRAGPAGQAGSAADPTPALAGPRQHRVRHSRRSQPVGRCPGAGGVGLCARRTDLAKVRRGDRRAHAAPDGRGQLDRRHG